METTRPFTLLFIKTGGLSGWFRHFCALAWHIGDGFLAAHGKLRDISTDCIAHMKGVRQ
jgi:hypothetical protein